MDYSSESLIKRLNNLEKRVDKLNNKLFSFNDLSSYVNGYYLSKKELDNYILGEGGDENMLEGDQFEQLDNELKKQKQVIEQKKGTVTMAGSHLIPSEITNGISSIKVGVKDTSQTTATPEDVKQGKTFYNADGELVEGTYQDLLDKFFYYDLEAPRVDETYDIHLPMGNTYFKGYLFYKFPYKVNLWINSDVRYIQTCACAASNHLVIKNWEELTILEHLHEHSLSQCFGIDLENIPKSMKILDDYCFAGSLQDSSGIILTENLTTIREYAFSGFNVTETLNKLEFPANFKLKELPRYMFDHCYFDCTVTIPEGIQTLNDSIFAFGGIKDAVFPTTLKTVGKTIFYDSIKCNTKAVTFLGEQPPTVGANFVHPYCIDQIKIYVPDNSLDAYKAIFNGYTVLPISQKP